MPRRDDFRWVEDDPAGGFAQLTSDKITRLGLGPEILRLKKLGYSAATIAKVLALNVDTTRRWIRNFNALTPSQKKEQLKIMEENSVFNLKDQLEKVYKQVQETTNLMENNPELFLKGIAEQRQLLRLAADVVEKVERINVQKQTIQIILNCIARVDPDTRALIMKELNAVKELRGLIT